MSERLRGDAVNSPAYWNRRFCEDWIVKGGRRQTAFFAALCVRELPDWLAREASARNWSILDYGCALGDALPVWRRAFPNSAISGGDVAAVGLGLARGFHPDFAFLDLVAIADEEPIADLIYCSNTLEHFAEWRPMLDRIGRLARRAIVLVVPFEEAEPIEEHEAVFEFDSFPAALAEGYRLLHLTVVDAAAEPDSQWHGLQSIAVYARDGLDPSAAATSVAGAMTFDLRGLQPPAIALLLGNLAAMSRGRRRSATEAAAARAEAARLREAEARAEDRNRILAATLSGAWSQYAGLADGLEAAQRWAIGELEALDPALVAERQISSIPEPAADRGEAEHVATFARLAAAIERANRLGLAFIEQTADRRAERDSLLQRLRDTRRRMECAIEERDRARGEPISRQRPAADMPLVSIVLPVFNQAYLVGEAIAGVLAQTYRNWELIVVDDGSTDDLESRVRQHVGERRALFLRQPNRRLPAALNQGFAQARGDFLTWISADNIMLPRQLERLVAELAAHPEAGLVYSDYWAIGDDCEPLADPNWRLHNRDADIPDLIRLPDAATIENFHRSGDNFIGASFLYRREVADIVGPYADDAFGGEDYDFWLRMHLVTEFRHVAEPLYKYRVHADTLTARADELGLFDNIRELLDADRWRTETLLDDARLSSGMRLRPVNQFHTAVVKRCRPISCRELAAQGASTALERPLAVDVDLPLRLLDPGVLRQADLLLCRSRFAAGLLRREDWAEGKRILAWDGEPTPAVLHAYIQAFADQVTASPIAPPPRTPAQIDERFRPDRILLLVERWSSGGLENLVIDLAESLAGQGCAVFVAAADGPPPAAGSTAGGRVRTLSFGGDEQEFAGFLRHERISVVNYHHSRFGLRRARELGAGTVYTLHNSYLWMDEAARAQVAAALALMDRLIAVSRQVAQFAAAQFSLPGERIEIIPNGLRDDILALRPRPAVEGDGPFVVAMVASLTRPKLHHVAIAAFAEVAAEIPALRLRLIGAPLDPEYRRELTDRIALSPDGGRIELVAGLSRAETVAALAAAQIFLLPSLVEGCSMALLEAAAQGCVCLASDVGAARDLVTPNGAVVLLPSPLGELDGVTQRQFLDAAAASLPQHRSNIAEALRRIWRDYGSYAAGAAETRARLRETADLARMTEAYRVAYALAYRGGPRPCLAEGHRPRSSVG